MCNNHRLSPTLCLPPDSLPLVIAPARQHIDRVRPYFSPFFDAALGRAVKPVTSSMYELCTYTDINNSMFLDDHYAYIRQNTARRYVYSREVAAWQEARRAMSGARHYLDAAYEI